MCRAVRAQWGIQAANGPRAAFPTIPKTHARQPRGRADSCLGWPWFHVKHGLGAATVRRLAYSCGWSPRPGPAQSRSPAAAFVRRRPGALVREAAPSAVMPEGVAPEVLPEGVAACDATRSGRAGPAAVRGGLQADVPGPAAAREAAPARPAGATHARGGREASCGVAHARGGTRASRRGDACARRSPGVLPWVVGLWITTIRRVWRRSDGQRRLRTVSSRVGGPW